MNLFQPAQPSGALALPPRSTAGQLTLDQHIGVRIPGGQPNYFSATSNKTGSQANPSRVGTFVGTAQAQHSRDIGEVGAYSETRVLSDAFLQYLQIERGAASNTIASYRREVERFCDFISSMHLRLRAVQRTD